MTLDELENFVDNIKRILSKDAIISFIQYDSCDEKVIVDYFDGGNDELMRFTYTIE